MMSGIVNANLDPMLRLTVRYAGSVQDIDAVIDTGFNGFLTLSPAIIAKLGLPWLCRQLGELADGSVMTFDVYTATVDWHGQPRLVEVEAADAQPLLGMSLMRDSELRIRVSPGGNVNLIEPS